MTKRFKCFADYILRHTNGRPWIVLNRPSVKHLTYFRFTEAQFSALKSQYAAEYGFVPYSDSYLAADNADWNSNTP